jgi:hypothetical protein
MHCGRRSHNPAVAPTSGCPIGCFGASRWCSRLAEAAGAFVAVGWVADSAGLNLARAGVETDALYGIRLFAARDLPVPQK